MAQGDDIPAKDERGALPVGDLAAGIGAASAAVGLVYLIGGVVMSLRYEGFGLSGQDAVAVTSREVLLFAGSRSLVIWTLLGLGLVLALRAIPRIAAIARPLWHPVGRGVFVAVLVTLLVPLKVWWPLAALVAVYVLIVSADYRRTHTVQGFLIVAAGIAVVAVAYEADRVTYRISWARVVVAGDAAGRAHEGILIGENERGVYLGSPAGEPAPARESRYRMVFLPRDVVRQVESRKQRARVVGVRAHGRREHLQRRLRDVEIR